MTEQAKIREIADGLTKARKKMIANATLGYIDDYGMDGPGRRMLYTLIGMGLFVQPDRINGPAAHKYSQASFVLSPLGLEVRAHILAQESSS